MIAIIDYNMGNVKSCANAFEALSEEVCVTNDRSMLQAAEAIVLPGVGAFSEGMRNLEKFDLIDALNQEVINKGKPYLGICLGMQFLAEQSLEHGIHKGFDWIKGTIRKLGVSDKKFKVPHIGWDNVKIVKKEGLFANLDDDPVFYFVHSYYLDAEDGSEELVTSTCRYGATVPVSVQKNNIFGVQFHPEKSQATGLVLLRNFVDMVKRGAKRA